MCAFAKKPGTMMMMVVAMSGGEGSSKPLQLHAWLLGHFVDFDVNAILVVVAKKSPRGKFFFSFLALARATLLRSSP